MLVARQSCSASMARANMCGQVIAPKAMRNAAFFALGIGKAVRCANEENGTRACRHRATVSQTVRKGERADRLAAFIQHDGDHRALGRRGSFPPRSGSSVILVGHVTRFM